MYNPLLISDYMISANVTLDVKLTPLQVIKLAYFSHGYTLALTDRPLITEKVEAWRFGPVFPSIYKSLKRYGGSVIPNMCYCGTSLMDQGSVNKRREFLNDIIDGESREIIDHVVSTYGNLSGHEMTALTHKPNTPWRQYYKEGVFHIKIPNSVIKQHYELLMQDE